MRRLELRSHGLLLLYALLVLCAMLVAGGLPEL
jgi:hypothetical protein